MNIFDLLNDLTVNKRPLVEEEIAEFQPMIINRYLYFTKGLETHAKYLNRYTFSLEKMQWFILAQKILPKRKFFFQYIKKPEKEDVSFFVVDVAKYFKINQKRAKEAIAILTEADKTKLAKKFGYSDKEFKSLNLIAVRSNTTMSAWW